MSYFEREVELASSVGRLPAEDTLTLTSMNEQKENPNDSYKN